MSQRDETTVQGSWLEKNEHQAIDIVDMRAKNAKAPAAPASGQAHVGDAAKTPFEYLKMIKELNEKHDEQSLQRQKFFNNFRCKSFIQSYNILDSYDYLNVDMAITTANFYIKKYLSKAQMLQLSW